MRPIRKIKKATLAAAVLLSMLGQGGGSLYTPIQTWFGIGFHSKPAGGMTVP